MGPDPFHHLCGPMPQYTQIGMYSISYSEQCSHVMGTASYAGTGVLVRLGFVVEGFRKRVISIGNIKLRCQYY